jgi:methylenetetrahydrofolate reductase (NADPH)
MSVASIRRLLESPRYELLPFASALKQASHLPAGATVSVTASPNKTLEETVDLASELSQRGFRAVPHLAARMAEDRRHVESLLGRIAAEDIVEVFVIGGDAEQRGDYFDAGSLLRDMEAIGHGLSVGIGAYPEGHHVFDMRTAQSALADKQRFADRLITQMCFDADAITDWLASIRADGITLPAIIGIPGVGDRTKLASVALRIGVGASVRFLSKNTGLVRALVQPGGYSADELLDDLSETLDDAAANITGVHIYTFNQVEKTERWRLAYLDRLRSEV